MTHATLYYLQVMQDGPKKDEGMRLKEQIEAENNRIKPMIQRAETSGDWAEMDAYKKSADRQQFMAWTDRLHELVTPRFY